MFTAALLLLLPFVASPFLTYQVAAQALIFGLIALSLSFLAGYGGMVSLAQMTVAGIAGYAVAVLGSSGTATSLGWPWWVVLPFALIIATLCATLIGWLSVRTDGIYTIMITLAIGVAFYYLVLQNYTVFNGFQGFQKVYPPLVLGINWRDPMPFYFLALFWALAGYFFIKWLVRTPFGIALQGIRDNPRRMNSLGFSVIAHRVAAYAVAGAAGRHRRHLAGLVQRPDHAGVGGHRLDDQRAGHRRARRHEAPDRRLPGRGGVHPAADLRHRRHRPRALQPRHRRRVPRHRAVFPRRPARTVGEASLPLRPEPGPDFHPHQETTVNQSKRIWVRTMFCAAAVAAVSGSAFAQQGQPVKIGLLATLEGPFAAGGADGMRGAELAVIQRGGTVAGRKIEIIKASSDAKPDVAVNATRKLVEQDKVDIMVGPLSGGEGIAVKDYSKTQPQVTFINGASGAQATTLVNPSTNFFRFNTEGAQWMVGLGKAAHGQGLQEGDGHRRGLCASRTRRCRASWPSTASSAARCPRRPGCRWAARTTRP